MITCKSDFLYGDSSYKSKIFPFDAVLQYKIASTDLLNIENITLMSHTVTTELVLFSIAGCDKLVMSNFFNKMQSF